MVSSFKDTVNLFIILKILLFKTFYFEKTVDSHTVVQMLQKNPVYILPSFLLW